MVRYLIHEVMITPFLSLEYSKHFKVEMIGSNVITGTRTHTVQHYELKYWSIHQSQGSSSHGAWLSKNLSKWITFKYYHFLPPMFHDMNRAWCWYSFTDVINERIQKIRIRKINVRGLPQRLIGGLQKRKGSCACVGVCAPTWMNLHCLNEKDGSLWRRIASP